MSDLVQVLCLGGVEGRSYQGRVGVEQRLRRARFSGSLCRRLGGPWSRWPDRPRWRSPLPTENIRRLRGGRKGPFDHMLCCSFHLMAVTFAGTYSRLRLAVGVGRSSMAAAATSTSSAVTSSSAVTPAGVTAASKPAACASTHGCPSSVVLPAAAPIMERMIVVIPVVISQVIATVEYIRSRPP